MGGQAPISETVIITADSGAGQHKFLRRISWGAILAGAAIAVACQLLLSLLGLGIGMSAADNYGAATDAAGDIGRGAGVMAGIWAVISGLVSLFVGGLVAGRLAGIPRNVDGMIHGILVWSVATIAGLVLATSAAAPIIGRNMNAMNSGMYSIADRGTGSDLRSANPLAPGNGITGTAGSPDASRAGLSDRVSTPGAQSDFTRRDADRVGKAALWSFLALLLGAAAAGFGGHVGSPEKALTTDANGRPLDADGGVSPEGRR